MPDQVEQVVLEVDERPAVEGTKRANVELGKFEKTGEQANRKLSGSFDQLGERIVRVTDRSRNSIERMVASVEKRAAAAGRSPLEKLVAERDQALQRVSGDTQAADRITRSFERLIKVQREGEGGARRFADAIRNPFQTAGNAVEGVLSSMGKIGAIAAGAGVGIGLLAKGAFDLVTSFDKLVDQNVHLGERLGITAQEADKLRRMSELVGVNVGAFEASMRLLSEALVEGSEEGKRGREVLREIGVQALDTRGKLRPMSELIPEIGRGLARIEDPAKRANAATRLLGRGALELLPLFREWDESARRVGEGMDEGIQRRLDEANNKIFLLQQRWVDLKAAFADKIVAVVDFVFPNGQPFGTARHPSSLAETVLGKTLTGGVDTTPPAPRAPGADFAESVRQRLVVEPSIGRGDELVRQFEARQSRTIDGLQRQLAEAKRAAETARQKVIPGVEEDVARERIGTATQAESAVRRIEAQIEAIKKREQAEAEAIKRAEALEKDSLSRRLKAVADFEKEFANEAADGIKRRLQLEEEFHARRVAFDRETAGIREAIAREREEEDFRGLERSRDSQLRQLETVNARTVEERLAVEQRKFEIESDFLRRSEALQLAKIGRETAAAVAEARSRGAMLFEAEASIQARIDAIREAGAERARVLSGDIAAQGDAARENSANRQMQILTDQAQRQFDDLKRGFDGLFDAAFTRARSFTDALKELFFATFLTPVKQGLSTLVASLLTGRQAAAGPGGFLGSLAGLVPGAGGFGGLTTPPFLPGGSGGGLGGRIAAGSLNVQSLAGLGVLGSGLGLLGAFRAGQSGNPVLRGAAPAIGAVSGAFGFGALAALFPQLAAAGPAGLIAAAGIGAGIGVLGLFRKSPEDKAREKIKAAYGVEIRDKGVLRQILGVAEQSFGGNIDMAIRHESVREIVELYALSTGQNAGGIAARLQPVTLAQSGGEISRISAGGGGLPSVSPLPRFAQSAAAGTPAAAVPAQFIVQLDGPATVALLRGEAVHALAENPRQVQAASIRATRSSSGRRELLSLQVAPGTITS